MLFMESENKILLYAPVVKSINGGYVAILSDSSIDRENEIVGKTFLNKIGNNFDYVPALADHKNSVFMQVGEWINKRVEEINGHAQLIAEPKFYKSNPNAQIIKGMLDEGARIGISIGAIPTNWKNTKINDKEYKEYTDGELLEASFVAIPANKHAMAMAVAKSLGCSKKPIKKDYKEEIKLEEEMKKYFDEMFNKLEEKIENLSKEVENLTSEDETEELEEQEESETEKALKLELEKSKIEIKNAQEKLKDLETEYKTKSQPEDKQEINKSMLPIL
jgi:hypothetical protein